MNIADAFGVALIIYCAPFLMLGLMIAICILGALIRGIWRRVISSMLFENKLILILSAGYLTCCALALHFAGNLGATWTSN